MSTGGIRFVLLASFVAAGCGDGRLKAVPPLPALGDLEPAVAERLLNVHASLAASPTPAAWIAWARTLHAHDMREATDAYEVAAPHLEPKRARFEALYLAGLNCVKRDPDRAVGLLTKAAAIDDAYLPLHLRLGALHERALRHEDARRHFERAQSITPSSTALAGLGRIALAEGRTDHAITTLESARALAPDHAEVHVALAQAYARVGRKQEAARATALAGDVEREHGYDDPIFSGVAREGVSISSLEKLGMAALRGKQHAEALSAFDKAAAFAPDSLGIALGRAQALVASGRFAEAEPVLERVLARMPDSPTAHAFLGGCALHRKDLERGIACLRRAVTLDPNLVDARWNLARALSERGRSAEAKTELVRVLDAKPHRSDARLMLATILAGEGRVEDAMAHVEQVMVQEPGNAKAAELKQRIANR